MIVIALKDTPDKSIVEKIIENYFANKHKPKYKFLEPLEKFNSWTPILIDPQEYTLEDDLIEFLSTELNLTVFGYEYQDTVTLYTIYLYDSGELIDEFKSLDSNILDTYGYFDHHIDNLDLHEFLDAYYSKLVFDPNFIKFEDQF